MYRVNAVRFRFLPTNSVVSVLSRILTVPPKPEEAARVLNDCQPYRSAAYWNPFE
jgi:hypothetical protein